MCPSGDGRICGGGNFLSHCKLKHKKPRAPCFVLCPVSSCAEVLSYHDDKSVSSKRGTRDDFLPYQNLLFILIFGKTNTIL